MVPVAVVLGLSMAISAALSAMLAIAWASLGRPRHAASWSAAHAATALQIGASLLLIEVPQAGVLIRPAIGALVIAGGVLGLVGVRQRRGERHWRRAAAAAAATLAVTVAFGAFGWTALQIATPGLAAAVLSITAAVSLRPVGRPARQPERALIFALVLVAAAELLVAFAAAALAAWPWWPTGRIAYAAGFAIGMPLGTIIAGIAAVLLLASDLATDLRRLAAFDPLTGVHNRRGFSDAAGRAIAVAARRRAPMAVALADVDHFKAINDRHGHGVGDRALIAIARHLSDGVRDGDVVARIGGEEFALLLLDLDDAAALETVERIRAGVTGGVRAAGLELDVTVSFGVAAVPHVAVPHVADTAPDPLTAALDRADRALYDAKTGGRNRSVSA